MNCLEGIKASLKFDDANEKEAEKKKADEVDAKLLKINEDIKTLSSNNAQGKQDLLEIKSKMNTVAGSTGLFQHNIASRNPFFNPFTSTTKPQDSVPSSSNYWPNQNITNHNNQTPNNNVQSGKPVREKLEILMCFDSNGKYLDRKKNMEIKGLRI